MKTMNQIMRQNNQGYNISFSEAITGGSLQKMIRKAVPDAASAARFTGSLIAAVAGNEELQQCDPNTLVAAALRGEGQGFSMGREYHLVPFGKSCAYVISYKGLIALALASGQVADMDCVEVRDGEFVGRDRRTKRPKFDFSVYETDEEAEKHPIIGYYAYVEMRDGYFRSEYMSVGEIMNHAEKYGNFERAKYDALYNGLGNYTPAELKKLRKSSVWYSNPETMMKKTVIRRLLNSGYVRLSNSAEIRSAMDYDASVESEMLPVIDADPATGEVTEGNTAQPAEAEERKTVEMQAAPDDENDETSFFD